MSSSSKPSLLADLLYRSLLLAYPSAFRAQFGPDMLQLFQDKYRDVRGAGGPSLVLRLWVRTFRDIVVQAALERAHKITLPWTRRSRQPRRHRAPRRRSGIMGTFMQDVRYAIRTLRKSPGFTLAAVATIALGIGANTAIFSTVNAVVLRPLPFGDPERLVWAWSTNEATNTTSSSAHDYIDYREQSDVFASLGTVLVFQPGMTVTGGPEPERVVGTVTSVNLFATLGVDPQIGRHFAPEEGELGTTPVVLVGHGYWQRRFGGAANVVGNTLTVDGTPYEIIGVMPSGFDFPGDVELWFPMRMGGEYANDRRWHNFNIIGRLAEGVTLERAQAAVDVVARRLEEAYPVSNENWGLRLVSLHDQLVGGVRQALFILMGAVGLVLLIACGNVASLLLARGTARQSEIAMRSALGAVRSRLVRQLLTESTLIAVMGGAAGLVLAELGLMAFRTMGPANLPRLETVAIDGAALVFTLMVSVLTGVVFGVAPAMKSTGLDLAQTLNAGRRSTAGGGGIRLQNGLVVAEVALSSMLLIGASLLIQSFLRLRNVDPGFDPASVLTAEVQLPVAEYGESEQRVAFYEQLLERVRGFPGVTAAGAIDQLPMGSGGTWNYAYAADRPPATAADRLRAQRRFATPEYFSTLGIPLVAGRTFNSGDRFGTTPVVIINQQMAEQFFPGENPLGQQAVIAFGEPYYMEVIGVAGDVRQFGLGSAVRSVMYLPHQQTAWGGAMQLVIRTDGDPLALAGALRNAVWEMDSNLPVSDLGTMEGRVAASMAQPKFRTILLGLFAGVALFLAALGLYGVLAYFVSRRIHEMGIRTALGASRGNVLGLVLRRGMMMAGAGLGLGLLGGVAATRVLQSLLFGVEPTDPLTFALVAVSLSVVAVAACVIPARRATRVDLLTVLRTE
jgi:putative ABC transport system permease protein